MTATVTRAATTTSVGSRWRARASLGEGFANLRDGAWSSAALVAIATLVVGGALLADVTAAGHVLAAERAYLHAGGDLLVAQPTTDRPLDAARCDMLSGVQGVVAAAGVSITPAAGALTGRPDSAQTVVQATAGIVDLLGLPDLGTDEVVVSTVIADRWQWAPGSHLQLADAPGVPHGVLTVAAVRDLGLLSEGASTGVLLVRQPAGDIDQCFVRIEPQYGKVLRDTLPAVLGETGNAAVNVSDRLPAGAFAQDPRAAWDGRATRWASAAAGLVVGLLWAVVAWTRRGRSALYASVGVPYSAGVLIRWTEGAGVVTLGTLWGAALALSVAASFVDLPLGVGVDIVLRGGLLALTVALFAVVLVGLWRPPTLAALKDR
ncbi:hypothetical protein [Cellulomonas sp. URHB0016]